MALYQVMLEALRGADASNPFICNFFYNGDDLLPSSPAAQDLANQFYSLIVAATEGWKSLVSTNMRSNRVVVTTPYNPTVLGINISQVQGTATGNSAPAFNAWGFKSERTRADIRAGFKRVGEISESDTNGNLPTTAALIKLTDFSGLISTPIDFTDGVSGFTATPVIVKRIPVVVGGVTVGYRLPNSPTELAVSIADNWAFQAITSQVSRKK